MQNNLNDAYEYMLNLLCYQRANFDDALNNAAQRFDVVPADLLEYYDERIV